MTLAAAFLAFLTAVLPLSRLGGEFLPPLDEGDLLYMPSALPGLSVQKASELLQQTDSLLNGQNAVRKTRKAAARVIFGLESTNSSSGR